MHQFLKIGLRLFCILVLVQLLYFLACHETWGDGGVTSVLRDAVQLLGQSLTVTVILMKLFDKYAWKWKLVRRIHDVPVLSKTYVGTIYSSYEEKDDGKNVKAERSGHLHVYQTFTKTVVELTTKESSSRSVMSYLGKDQGGARLIYTYQNDPSIDIQERSPIHYGTAVLRVNAAGSLKGFYFTTRKTTGEMEFEAVDKETI